MQMNLRRESNTNRGKSGAMFHPKQGRIFGLRLSRRLCPAGPSKLESCFISTLNQTLIYA